MESEEPMDIDARGELDDVLEEGEYVEPNRITRNLITDIGDEPVEAKIANKDGVFITGIDVFSKEAKAKKEERAKRFGIKIQAERIDALEADELYASFGIVQGSQNALNWRLNVLHMRGTENMTTKDIFKYFKDYAPASIEWINDISCNVVWLDKESAARAILGLSKKIVGIKNRRVHSDNESDEESDDEMLVNGQRYVEPDSIHVKDLRCPIPPGIWRKGRDYMDSRNIFLRFASRSDRKPIIDEKAGLRGILSTSRKRTHRQMRETSPDERMEGSANGIAAKNPWGALSKNWGMADFVEDDYLPKAPPKEMVPYRKERISHSRERVPHVKERLGFRPQQYDSEREDSNVIELSDGSESESSSEEESWSRRSKMPRMRMHADDEEEKLQRRKGKIREMGFQQMHHSEHIMSRDVQGHDLRGKLIARRRLPPVEHEKIHVVVTNPKAIRSDFRDLSVTERETEEEDDESEVSEDESDESESSDDTSDSSVSEKEIQGPKGSVIKVVQHKPKLASTVATVLTRVSQSRNKKDDRSSEERHHSRKDLRSSLKKNDLRSRIGNHHMRGRSPLRIELRNDKYAGTISDCD
ncbi:hypothetical protein QAD02_015830 [Eretmocerus hayati]|uniref:Uncharacterized protein n=1 Tax=Eretmocerus hayati TaxID=131215 RepID=A0ACC2PAB8_9HYME|nr:hypothetical protein QAD02_015830 [Eretmocerus hayati]